MRFTVVLVLLTIIAYASCNVVSDMFIFKQMSEKEVAETADDGISIPIGDRKAACTIGWCIDVCLSIMKPPFTATCSGNYCICRKQ